MAEDKETEREIRREGESEEAESVAGTMHVCDMK